MSFKKVFKSGNPIIIGDSENSEQMFPPGFTYRIGGIIYTVVKDVTQEPSSSMREVHLSDGATEIIPVESIIKDLKEVGCEVLEMDKKYAKQEVKDAVKAKPSKKKSVKKKKKNG
jgi:hypothetical protein